MIIKKILLVLTLALSASAAFAISLEDAKREGLVGEDAGGYLAAVSSPSKDVRDLVRDVNEKRSQEYQRIAESNDIAITDVEQLAGRKAIEKTAAGQYIRLPGGNWQKK